MVIFNSYVKLPEGSSYLVYVRMTYNDNVLIIKKIKYQIIYLINDQTIFHTNDENWLIPSGYD